MKKGKHLSSKTYTQIKSLLEDGYTPKQIKELTLRAESTISRIKHSVNFEDYRRLNREHKQKTDFKKITATLGDVTPGSILPGIIQDTATVQISPPQPLSALIEALERSMEDTKHLMSKVIVQAVKEKVDEEMKKVAVELNELRNLRDMAKTQNWGEALKERLAR